jgi:hypothetical protein
MRDAQGRIREQHWQGLQSKGTEVYLISIAGCVVEVNGAVRDEQETIGDFENTSLTLHSKNFVYTSLHPRRLAGWRHSHAGRGMHTTENHRGKAG